ncbi:hypothetical protein [Rheinheimera hassiensis]|uniref:hypothetical protein n=1 Tax=Rheinheimera hassiensis TaxID=1193627 RepID=UPI001F052D99|nr:hypothetical protein [Rheinheimera hassiensis]
MTNESLLHAFAKQCLKKAVGTDKVFKIPRVEVGKVIPKTLSGEISDSVMITAAELEYRDENIATIPDVRLTTSNGWVLNVEIKVTHGIDKTKTTKIIAGKAFTLEITLDTHSQNSFKLEEVEKEIFGINGKTVWNHPEAQIWQHNPKSTYKARSAAVSPVVHPPPRLPPREKINLPQDVCYELKDCYLSHDVSADDNGLNVVLEFCNEHGEVLKLPVIKFNARYYASIFEELEPGSKIMVITHNSEIVSVRRY